MGAVRRRALPLLAWAAALIAPQTAAAQVVTARADALRTGWYRDQPQLSPGQVTGGTFGRLFDAEVAGQVYAQPLVADGTLLIATEDNEVYGLDPLTGARKWTRELGTPFDPGGVGEYGCGDLYPHVGVTATPVVDGDTAYMTAKTLEDDGSVAYWMHALDVRTGSEKSGFPVAIAGEAGNAPGKAFDPRMHLQRPALLLLDGVVYAAFGGHCDISPYQGWVAGVSTAGRLTALWTAETAPGADGAGIWQAGGGLMSDGPGRMFLATGNFNSPPFGPGDEPPGALGQSVARVDVQGDGSLRTKDFFSPFDADVLDGYDADFGSGGPVGLPSAAELPGSPFGTPAYPRLLVAVGKVGYVYLLDRDALGGRGEDGGGDAVVARIGPYGGVWSSPAVWPGDGGWIYIPTASPGNVPGGSSGALNFYRSGVDGQGRPTLSLTATTEPFGFGSSAPVVTSDGTQSGSALVWLTWSPGTDSPGAQLRAYPATPPAGSDPAPLWSAPIGVAAKFAPPGVADGRVYVGTADGHVYGYGSPVDPALTGPDVVCGEPVAVGASRTCEAVFTARRDVHVTGVNGTSPAFVPSAPALPLDLQAGDRLTIPVTFTAQSTGPAGGSVRVQTTEGQFAVGVTGTGIADGPLLASGTPVLSFGGIAQGRKVTGTVILRNAGSQPLTIDEIISPSAPFSISGAPGSGDELPPGEEVTVSVVLTASQIGDYEDDLTVRSSGGDVEVGLVASVRTPPELSIGGSGAFGDVVVGESAERTVTLTNTGGSRLTITKSKPPVGGDFRALTSVPEGSSIAPGRSVTLTVRFTPASEGPAHAAWTVTADDGTGVHDIAFEGTGVAAPAPTPTPAPFDGPPAPLITPTPTPTPTVTPPRIKPKLTTLHAKTDQHRRRISVSFVLDRAITVRVELLRGKRVARRVSLSGRRGTNRLTVTLGSLRAGRYTLRLTPAGGSARTHRIRVSG